MPPVLGHGRGEVPELRYYGNNVADCDLTIVCVIVFRAGIDTDEELTTTDLLLSGWKPAEEDLGACVIFVMFSVILNTKLRQPILIKLP